MKKILVAAGLLTATLVVYKTINGGSLRPPSFSSTSSAVNLPARPPALAGSGNALASQSNSSTASAPADSQNVSIVAGPTPEVNGTVTPVFIPSSNDDSIHERIARAEEASKKLMNSLSGPSTAEVPSPKITTSVSVEKGNLDKTGITFAGNWAGDFLGPDSGTISVQIDPDGSAKGEGVSGITGIRFALTGKVSTNGKLELSRASGDTATGATFSGVLKKDGTGTGEWSAGSYGFSGTWQISAKK